MRIVQTVFGVFHHFELARELDRRGHLERVYSTWPWSRLKREGLPRSKVQTFPWISTAEYLLARNGPDWPWATDHLGYWNALAFDRWTDKRIPNCDALIAISGAALETGKRVQQRGGVFICDRGSTHQRFQQEIIGEEFRIWGVDRAVSDERDTVREELIYEQADAITVPSRAAARSFASMGVPAEKVTVIPYGVRLENFYPDAEPASDCFHVLFAGAAGLRKGVPYLLAAFAALKHPRKCLRIAGAILPDLKAVLSRLPREQVEFLGVVPQARLRSLMSASHALVLPSIEEGLALVQAQAMACGCPVICSTNTGGEDLFTDSVEGFIVPIRDSAALAARMQQLADDPALQQTMRAAALRRVQSIGGWSEYGDRWVELLLRLT
jgi:alpha-maltose-1-phosphate synthase